MSPTPVLGAFTVAGYTVGDAPFSLTAPSSTSPGAFSFSSSNPAVASVSGSTVTITGGGTATITATQAAYGSYAQGSTTALISVKVQYATFSKAVFTSKATLSADSLTATMASGNSGRIYGSTGKSTGKWYWEVTSVTGESDISAGIASSTQSYGTGAIEYNFGGTVLANGSTVSGGSIVALAANDTLTVALDMDTKKVTFGKNCAAIVFSVSVKTSPMYPFASMDSFRRSGPFATEQVRANFGSALRCAVPAGYTPLQ